MLTLIRAVDVLVTCLGVVGIAVGILLASQSEGDRRTAVRRRRNGWFRLHAVVGIRDGVSVAITHVILGGLGLLALLSPPPLPSRYPLAFTAAAAYIAVQAMVIVLQAWNVIDGYRLRRREGIDG